MPLSSLTTRNTCKNNNSVYLLFNLKIIMLPGSESVLNTKYNGIKYCKYNAVKYCQNGKKKRKQPRMHLVLFPQMYYMPPNSVKQNVLTHD